MKKISKETNSGSTLYEKWVLKAAKNAEEKMNIRLALRPGGDISCVPDDILISAIIQKIKDDERYCSCCIDGILAGAIEGGARELVQHLRTYPNEIMSLAAAVNQVCEWTDQELDESESIGPTPLTI